MAQAVDKRRFSVGRAMPVSGRCRIGRPFASRAVVRRIAWQLAHGPAAITGAQHLLDLGDMNKTSQLDSTALVNDIGIRLMFWG